MASSSRDRDLVASAAIDAATDELLTRLVFKFARSLGAMRSTTQALLNGGDEDRMFRREMLGDMDAELRELQRLIDNVVQFRAFAKGTFRLQLRSVLPAMLLWGKAEAWRLASANKAFDWRIEIPEELEPVVVDSDKLQQILDNLLSNIVRDTPPGSTVVLHARTFDRQLELCLEADASRLAQNEYGRIFDLFYTGLQQGRFPTGTGLGLYVARRLAQAHGGSLQLNPPDSGSGRLAWVLRLPLSPTNDHNGNGHGEGSE